MEHKRKRNNFSRALEEAKKRVKSAIKERERIRKRLDHLNREIPSLERTIEALQRQLNPDAPIPLPKFGMATGPQDVPNKVYGAAVDPYADAMLAVPQDFTGMGSIPPGAKGPAQPELTEDELLPDPVGKPLAGE